MSSNADIRANDVGAPPVISLFGDTIDLWVCVQACSQTHARGGGDCPFGDEGGTAIACILGVPQFEELNDASVNRYRENDVPLNKANWNAQHN